MGLTPAAIQSAIAALREEIDRQRKANHEKQTTLTWYPEKIRIVEQTMLLDWVEKELHRIEAMAAVLSGSETSFVHDYVDDRQSVLLRKHQGVRRRMQTSDAELMARTVRAYSSAVRKEGNVPQSPSAGHSAVRQINGKTYVVLGTGDGILAIYCRRADGVLKRLQVGQLEYAVVVLTKHQHG